MTLALSILALFFALGCLSVLVILVFRVSALAEEVDDMRNTIEGLRLRIKDLED